jgi:two-component system, sensor histidine kinase and response regulator
LATPGVATFATLVSELPTEAPGEPARFRELRIDAHLLKPVQQEELLETIYRVMSPPAGNGPTNFRPAPGRDLPTTPARAAAPLRILVAEDNEFSARLMDQLFTRQGHRVWLANDGRAALALAEEGVFDLLLLDMFAAIDRLVQAPGGSHRISRPDQADAGERRSLLDPVAVLTACGDDAEGLRKMCQGFQAYSPARMAEVVDALRDRDAPRLRRAAHKFCALLFAFSTVAGNVASDLEDHATQGQLEEAQPLVEQLETMTRELMQLAGGLSLKALRQQAEASRDRQPAGQPIKQQPGDR